MYIDLLPDTPGLFFRRSFQGEILAPGSGQMSCLGQFKNLVFEKFWCRTCCMLLAHVIHLGVLLAG